ncbi:hypothetical protein CKO28_12395 [Rhodovibrio sodomensis]|uniref:CHASE2 domain-containing protein n=1 Tax=Rhodovibrio sodomensis TaxID=1088 RepID=A0ABS1DFR8_9PROT|nr:hypothetical protein [Rhodovibrio sodomensis]
MLVLALAVVSVLGLELFDPYGMSSASDRISRQSINAVLAPWYDLEGRPAPEAREPVDAGEPASAQDAAIVLLITDRSLENAHLSWPLAATQWLYRLQQLAEEHRPAAVVFDVLFTHERPDPRVPAAYRPQARSGLPNCQFVDPDPARNVAKAKLRSQLLMDRHDPQYRSDLDPVRAASHPKSAFWCLKYHYRPVDGPTYPVDVDGPDGRYGTGDDIRLDPRIPLIQAVPNPAVSGAIARRLMRAEAPGDFVMSQGPAVRNLSDAALRDRLLIPGLRGIATPAVVQSVTNPQEPGVVPLAFNLQVTGDDGSQHGVNLTTPAVAALAAYCRHLSSADFPGCRSLNAEARRSTAPSDTVTGDGDAWDWRRPLFLRWGLLPAETESFVKPDGNAWPGYRSRAQTCTYPRSALEQGDGLFARLKELVTRAHWSVDIALSDGAGVDRAGDPGSARQNCLYTPTMVVDVDHWPVRVTDLMRTHPDGPVDLGELIDGRVVFIGTNFDVYRDETLSPVHEALPGVYKHAMAFDNLLRFGDDWKTPAPPIIGAGLSLIDLLQVLALAGLGAGGLMLREWLSPTYVLNGSTEASKRDAAWEPILIVGCLLGLLVLCLIVTPWPAADWLTMLPTLAVYYRERLLLAGQMTGRAFLAGANRLLLQVGRGRRGRDVLLIASAVGAGLGLCAEPNAVLACAALFAVLWAFGWTGVQFWRVARARFRPAPSHPAAAILDGHAYDGRLPQPPFASRCAHFPPPKPDGERS